jgi:hypothetical protein
MHFFWLETHFTLAVQSGHNETLKVMKIKLASFTNVDGTAGDGGGSAVVDQKQELARLHTFGVHQF